MKQLNKYSLCLASFISLIILNSCNEEDLALNNNFVTTKHALTSTTCTIVLGGGGNSQTISHTFTTTTPYTINTSANWDFIRSTSGYCRFEIYNGQNQTGSMVTLGSDLSVRIRAGEDGIKNKDNGGGDTWKIRSVKLIPHTDNERTCYVNIGGNGVRMNYYVSNYAKTPAMDRLTYFLGGNCDAIIWNGAQYGTTDPNRRNQAIHTNAVTASQGSQRPNYDPGFRVRSMEIEHHGQYCNSYSYNYDFGRCLPNITLSNSIYASVVGGTDDRDYDGLVDSLENQLAEAFRPIVMNDSDENATLTNMYIDADGNSVMEPVSVFQVRKADFNGVAVDTNGIAITYMQLWKEDKTVGSCIGHDGDTQSATIILKTPPSSSYDYGKYWWVYAENGVDQMWDPVSVTAYYGTQPPSGNSTQNYDVEESEYLQEEIKSQSIEDQEAEEREEIARTGIPFDPFDNSDLINYVPDLRSPSEKDADIRHDHTANNTYPQTVIDNTSSYLRLTGTTVNYQWVQGDIRLRAPRFERWSNESVSTQRHVIMNFSKGKHHQYFDGTASGYDDDSCNILASNYSYANGRGQIHNPPYPKRLLSVRSPVGSGDAYNYNNVGSRNKYAGFLNYLSDLGYYTLLVPPTVFKVWVDACFYSSDARAIDRHFYCSNNINKLCCLQENPGCTIPSNWTCH